MLVTAGKGGKCAAAPHWSLVALGGLAWGKGRERASLKDMETQTVASQTQKCAGHENHPEPTPTGAAERQAIMTLATKRRMERHTRKSTDITEVRQTQI